MNTSRLAGRTTADSATSEPNLAFQSFVTAFGGHPGGVAVITADNGNGPVGLTATSVSSVSADPPLLVFSMSEKSSSAPVITAASTVVVHLLDEDQIDIAKLCATSGIDRFADTSIWSRLDTGEPFFHNARTWIRGGVIQRVHLHGATLIVVRAINAQLPETTTAAPLVYHRRKWHRLDDRSTIAN